MFQPQKGAELGSFGNVVLALVCKIKKKGLVMESPS